MKRTGIKRQTPLKSGSGLKAKPAPKPRGEIVNFIWRRDLGPCAVCPAEGGECAGPVQGHHCVSQETLKKHGFTSRLMDLRNRLPICERRHSQHTNKFRPIPRELLPASAFVFADELGLGWYLDKHYPTAVSEREGGTMSAPQRHDLRSRSETAGRVEAA